MSTRAPLRRLHFLIVAILAMATLALAVEVRAQDDEVGAAQASPGTEEQVSVGWMQLVAVTCEVVEGSASVSIYLASEFAPDASCYDGYAAIWIDGIDYGAAAPVLEVELGAATYTVTEPVSGASRAVDVYPGALTVAYVVTTAPIADETVDTSSEESVESAGLSIRMHVCDPAIQDADTLLSLGGRFARLAECPVLTLPDHWAPDGTTTAGQAWFDLAVSDGDAFSSAASGGAFSPAAVCESDIGVQLSADPYDNACFSTSTYDLSAPASSLSLTLTALPDLHRFGWAEAGDDASAGSVWVIDQSAGMVGADLASAADPLVVDVYLFAPPALSIVQHLCGPEIGSPEALEGLGGFLARVNACPSVDRSGLDFDATVADGIGVSHYLSNTVPETMRFCEADLGFDFNGNANDNDCLVMPAYTISNVARGAVEVYPVFGSETYTLGGIDFTPGTNDGSTFLGLDRGAGQVALDTSFDGNVVLHLYAITETPEPPAEPTATATLVPSPTATASPTATVTPTATAGSGQTTGTIQIVALYCLGNQDRTTLTALPPGQQASQNQIGGTCFGGDARIQLTYAGQGSQLPFTLGRDGVEWIEGVPATGTAGSHQVTHLASGETANFAVQPGVVTRLLLRVEAALGVPSGTAAEGSQPGGSQPGGSQPGGTTGVNPLDLIGMLVTDVLVTDTLNYADAGENMAGSYDSNSYTVDLLGGLAVDELASVTADGLPAVGNGEKASSSLSSPLAILLAFALAILGLGAGIRRHADGVPVD